MFFRNRILRALHELKESIMAELDDLKASVAKLETDLATNTSVLNKVRADLATALANAGPTGVDPAAVEAIAKQITTDATGLETEDAGPPAPAPTPTPPVTPPSA